MRDLGDDILGDIFASAEYRRAVAPVWVKRALDGGHRPREVIPASIDDLQAQLGAEQYIARPRARDVDLPRAQAAAAAAARRRGGRRQDRGRQGACARLSTTSSGCSATKASTSATPCTSGTTRGSCSNPADGGAGAVDRATAAQELFSRAFLIKRPLLQALRADDGRRAGAAHRRARSSRRGVRRLPARVPLRLPGDDSGAWHDPRRRTADRHHHVEPDARTARRAEAALPVSLDRLSRLRQGTRDRHGEGAGRARAAGRAGDGVRPGVADGGLYKTAGVSETLDWVAALVALDRKELDAERSSTRSASCSRTRKTCRRSAANGFRIC